MRKKLFFVITNLMFLLGFVSVVYGAISNESIRINNLGIPGFEDTNPGYTSLRSVFLHLNYSTTALQCRYINVDNPTGKPGNGVDWTKWEPCISDRLWLLSEGDGLKYVFYQVYYPSVNVTKNDTIYYNHTGTGLDTTPATKATIIISNYTNNNKSVYIEWTNATDPESEILGISLIYNVLLINSSGGNFDSVLTTNLSAHITLSQEASNGESFYVNMTIRNSGNLITNLTSLPNTITVDLDDPAINLLYSTFRNLSSGSDETLIENTTSYGRRIDLQWNASDSLSDIYGYSYILTKYNSSEPDDIPEGPINNLSGHKQKTFSNLNSGTYYFKVKPRDKAGNWGGTISFMIVLDNTGPSIPQILSETKNGMNYTYTWSASSDSESGIIFYMINLTNSSGVINSTLITGLDSRTFTFRDVGSGAYEAEVGARNGAGIWSWSSQNSLLADTTPPIIKVSPVNSVTSITQLNVDPILQAWTNEPAICYHNTTTGTSRFKYTNDTYHETKLYSLTNNVAHRFNVTCTDRSGNSASKNSWFNVQKSWDITRIGAYNTYENYEGQIGTIKFFINNTSTKLLGPSKDLFDFKIDGEDYEYYFYEGYNGTFNISFIMPQAGDYAITLIGGSVTKDINLTSKPLTFGSSYYDASLSKIPENTQHMIYMSSNSRLGMATDSDINLNNFTNENNTLNISTVDKDDNIFIFHTKKTSSFLNREKSLKKNDFDDFLNPSFGYPLIDTYILNLIIDPNDYNIKSNSSEISIGKHQFIIENTISITGRKELLINKYE